MHISSLFYAFNGGQCRNHLAGNTKSGRRHLRPARDSGRNRAVGQLISDLLTLARGDEGQTPFEHERVQFDLLVETVAETLEMLVTERDIQLEVQTNVPVTLV